MVDLDDSRPLTIDSSTFSDSLKSSVALSGQNSDPQAVTVTNSHFERSCTGLYALNQAFTAAYNVFDATITNNLLYVVDDRPVIEFNRFAGPVYLTENDYDGDPEDRLTIRFNDFLAAVHHGAYRPEVMRWNWWGRVIPMPGQCMEMLPDLEPDANWGSSESCDPFIPLLEGYKSAVLPALTAPVFGPPPPGGAFGDEEYLGGGNLSAGAQPCATNVGEPIECSSGNFWHTFDALSVPGRGEPLDFKFTYNSNASQEDGSLGYGWTHTYGMRVETDGSTATVHQENGSQVPFTSDGSIWTAPLRFDADLESDGSGWTFTRRGVERFAFDSSGRLTSMRSLTDPASDVTTVSYPSSESTVVTDVAGRSLTFSLVDGRIVSVADSATPARVVSFEYNAAGELVGFTGAAGGYWAFGYEAGGSHRLTTMRKPNGAGVTDPPRLVNAYDPEGRVIEQTDWEGRTTTFEYSSAPGSHVTTTLITDPRGNITMKVFAGGVLIGQTRGYGTAEAASWGYELDPDTLGVTRTVDPAGEVTTASYDARGNRLGATDELGRTSSWTYDDFNNVLTATAPNPSDTGPATVTTTFTYDEGGRLTGQSRPLYSDETTATSQEVTFTRGDPSHPDDVTQVTDPDGKVTTLAYDGATGNLLSETDPLGNTTTYGYDEIGRVTSIVSPNGNAPGADPNAWTTTLTYNATGQPLEVVEHIDASTTATTTRTYDADGNLATVTDANNHTTEYVYDAADQLVEVVRPDSTTLVNEYWPDGLLKTQRDASGAAMLSYDHDSQGRLISATDALGNTTTLGYDKAGNVAWQADPGGSCPTEGPGGGCTRYSYDDAGQLTGIAYSDGTTPTVTYEYGPAGQRTTMTDGTGTTGYSYDSLGRLTSTTDGAGATVAYRYNLRDHLTDLGYPGLGTVTYAWDDAGRIDTVTDWADRTYTYSHDANGNVSAIEFPSGSGNADRFAYNHANHMTASIVEHNGSSVAASLYGRDLAGQVIYAPQSGLPGGSQSYGYTALDQLCYAAPAGTGTCSNPPTGATSYTYDPADNLTATAAAATQRFNAANQLCWTNTTPATEPCDTPPSGATTYTYDSRGNRTATTPAAEDTTTYTYDQANRLVATAGPVTSSYTYNGDGLRTANTIEGATATFTWSHVGALPVLLDDGTNAYIYGPDGLPVAHQDTTTGDLAYYHHDQLGSTRLLTGADGGTIGAATYNPHGNPVATTGETSPLGFAGQYTDSHTGLQYLRARYYDPATGQFLTRDPLARLTHEPYAYARNSPINYIDPLGLAPWDVLSSAWDATGGTLVGGVSSFIEDPGGFVQRNRHALIDVGTGVAAVSACATVVGCVAVAGLGLAAHVGSDQFFDDGRDISTGEAVFRTTTATGLGALNGAIFGQGSVMSAAGFPAGTRMVPGFLQRNLGVGPRWVAALWFGLSGGTRWTLHQALYGPQGEFGDC